MLSRTKMMAQSHSALPLAKIKLEIDRPKSKQNAKISSNFIYLLQGASRQRGTPGLEKVGNKTLDDTDPTLPSQRFENYIAQDELHAKVNKDVSD